MFIRHFYSRKIRLFTIFVTFFILYISVSNHAVSQPSLPNKTLVLGIRTISSPVAGFCQAFRETLKDQINSEITIESVEILNSYKGKEYSRYLGLLKNSFDSDHVDIECGPNSELSGNLENPKTKKPFKEDISFRKFFFPTGIKLLLKQEYAKKLKDVSSLREFEEEIKNLKIGVLELTSTSKQLEDNKDLYDYVLIESHDQTNALERVLNALDNDGILDDGSQIDAFASDDLILQSLLHEGINESGDKGKKLYVKNRNGYKADGYAVFPSNDYPSFNKHDLYLPRLNPENYAIAIKKGSPNESWLSEKIRNSLDESSIPGSKLKKALDKLKDPYPPIPPDPPESTITNKGGTTKTPPTSNNKWWIPILTAIIAALASIIVAILNPQLIMLIRELIWGGQTNENNSTSASITGRVTNDTTNSRIDGAKVILEADRTSQVKYTDGEGIFEFNFNTSNNRILLRVEKENYHIYEREINISNVMGIERIRLIPNSDHNL